MGVRTRRAGTAEGGPIINDDNDAADPEEESVVTDVDIRLKDAIFEDGERAVNLLRLLLPGVENDEGSMFSES